MKKTVIILLLLPVLLFAGTTGKLTGKVTDASTGEPLIGVNILLEGTTLGAATDVNGNYTILNIPPGLYSVRISFIGYTTITVNNVRILVDLTTTLPVQLSSSSIAMDEVVVVARNPLVQKDLTSTKSVMSRDEIESLPVSNFLDMLSIQAGVVGSGNNLHIRGGRADEVAYLVDGMYVQDPLLGGLATSINNDAIQEMSLLSGTFNAEYGNALSGVVNIVTRDGGEDFRGKLEVRTSEFGVKDYTDLHELRMNGSLSGPVTQDIRFFLSGEQDKRGSYLPFGYNRQVTGFGKLTFLFIPGLKIALASRYSSGERQNYSHTFKYIPERYAKSETESYHGSLTLTHSVLNNLFYDLKLSYFSQTYFNGWDRDTSIYLAEPFPYLVKVENG
ncbi:partial Protein oar, partial [uncultured bacterium]